MSSREGSVARLAGEAASGAPPEVVQFFDTTLRDGEQCPGATLHPADKLLIAHQLKRLNVDVIEAGFPASSPGDFQAVQQIAREVEGPAVTGLARTKQSDIDAVHQAVRDAPRHLIHVFMSVSDIHITYKLGLDRATVLVQTAQAIAYAKSLCDTVQFSPEDAGRTDLDYLCTVVQAAVDAGANVINLPDTTGYCLPNEFQNLVATVRREVRGMEQVLISVHCHDDLGLATANSLAGIAAGARRVEGCINGIGERAGNASLEEILMALRVRRPVLGLADNLQATELVPTSRLVAELTGMVVPANKPVVGANAFAHASGVHQHGVLRDRRTYEIIAAEDVGAGESKIVLTARSGRHALRHRLDRIGLELPPESFQAVWTRFLEVADTSKEVEDETLTQIVGEVSGVQAALRAAPG
ncbi:MAG TPA: 2-isopropylmalate synthase [Candidatus Dormibacteraeota bacterium]|nr:2-isopropylmalate synthase [Candidatus Dormibacteraeota bacterium]